VILFSLSRKGRDGERSDPGEGFLMVRRCVSAVSNHSAVKTRVNALMRLRYSGLILRDAILRIALQDEADTKSGMH